MKKFLWLRFLIVLAIFLSIALFTCCQVGKKTSVDPKPAAQVTENGFDISNKGPGFKVGFYNVENLFDTEDDAVKIDSEYLPTSRLKWTQERYEKKLANLAKVIEGMGFPAILGVCEIENARVLQDLTNQPNMTASGYVFAHFESPDERGIDVAMLYKKADFTVKSSRAIPIKFSKSSDKTRDILEVIGTLKGQPLAVYINHWPSRRGEDDVSEPKRIFVAEQLRKAVAEASSKNKNVGIVIMGDLNDTPSNVSVSQTLNAQEWTQSASTDAQMLYNLGKPLEKRNEGTIYYKGWSVFDQIIVSGNLMDKADKEMMVFKMDFMTYTDKNGNKLPNRTYTGPIYRGGYSDHFPVFVHIYVR